MCSQSGVEINVGREVCELLLEPGGYVLGVIAFEVLLA